MALPEGFGAPNFYTLRVGNLQSCLMAASGPKGMVGARFRANTGAGDKSSIKGWSRPWLDLEGAGFHKLALDGNYSRSYYFHITLDKGDKNREKAFVPSGKVA